METETPVEKASNKIGDRFKAHEQASLNITQIAGEVPFVVRLDGHRFSKLTKHLNKKEDPFDRNFIRCMVLTMNDLVKEFTAQTGYTHSDEITVIFAPAVSENDSKVDAKHPKCHIYGGRVMKICTLMAGYCSARFNFHMKQFVNKSWAEAKQGDKPYNDKALTVINEQKTYFDARVVVFQHEEDKAAQQDTNLEIVNHQIWRSIHDCARNTISTYARYLLGHKMCMNKTSWEMLEMMKVYKKFDYFKRVPMYIRHGVYCKKLLVCKEAKNELTGESVIVLRPHYENRCFRVLVRGNLDVVQDVLLAKY